MLEPFIGEICQYTFNYAPKGWAYCHGQVISIQQNPALFSLLGTTYGGNGVTAFNLPDLRPKDANGNPLQLRVGDIHEGKVFIESFIALQGIYPPRD